MVKKVHFTDPSKSCSSKGNDLRTHFKNTYEIGRAIRGMMVKKAEQYLKEVLEHKKCIPYTRYNHSMGRTSQALQFGLTKGRWPEKSIKIVLGLLKKAVANAYEAKKTTPNLLGTHLEGPYICVKYKGAQPEEYIVKENRLCSPEYALNNIQERAQMFVAPGVHVYEGMIVRQYKDNKFERYFYEYERQVIP